MGVIKWLTGWGPCWSNNGCCSDRKAKNPVVVQCMGLDVSNGLQDTAEP